MEKRVREDTPRLRVLSIVLRDVPQALSRVVGLFSARGYNIEELTVCRAKSSTYDGDVSRVTIGTISSDHTCRDILAQVEKIFDVLEAVDLTDDNLHAQARITLVKVAVTDRIERMEATTTATLSFRADQIRTDPEYLMFRFAGRKQATDIFIKTMEAFGPVESASTGVTALL